MNEFPISRAKVTPPPVRQETLSRGRLLAWLDSAVLRRVVFVVAEAGYGKTTLLADFTHKSRVRCLWLRLDEPDRDWLTFLHYLVAAGREAVPDFAPTTAALLRQATAGEPVKDAAMQALAGELDGLGDRSTALIFDDYHLVDGTSDVGRIVQRMIRAAPERMSLIFLSRRRPSMRVARLHALDEMRELGRDELRFNRDETERLFSEAYKQPLEADVLDEVESRTEGWAASLQMLNSGIRGRSPTQIRAFVRGMSGAEGRLYDYLAEEVIGDLPEPMRRFLMRTSVLDRVTPELARAALAADQSAAPALHEIRGLIQRCEEIGLLWSRGESTRWSHRYHPLTRDHLLRKLAEELETDEIRALHRTIAREAEATSWAVAAHHWLEAGESDQVVATIERQIASIAASGQYSLAADYLARARVDTPGEVAGMVQARMDLYAGRIDRARAYLRSALRRPERHSPEALQLLMSIATFLGDQTVAVELGRRLLRHHEAAQWQRAIVRATLLTKETATAGPLERALEAVEDAAILHERERRWHLAAIGRLNMADIQRLMGDYVQAIANVDRAVAFFDRSQGDALERSSAIALKASCLGDLDDLQTAETLFKAAEKASHVPGFAFEIQLMHAEFLADIGKHVEAINLVAAALTGLGARHSGSTLALTATTGADVAAKAGDLAAAAQRLALYDAAVPSNHCAALAHQSLVRARIQVLSTPSSSTALAQEAARLAESQGARHYQVRAEILLAVANRDPIGLTKIIEDAVALAPGALRAEAAAICSCIDLLDVIPAALATSFAAHSDAWRPHLRRGLRSGEPQVRLSAARLLDAYGERSDVRPLRRLARATSTPRRDRHLGKALSRATAFRVEIEDLGRTEIHVGERRIEATSIRRKAAGLLVLLLTRPGLAATRDQVLEALWPDAPPEVGTNSLHQTVYFLRRDLETDYEEDTSPGYVRLEGELIWLDPELVTAASHRFRALASSTAEEDWNAAVLTYRGKFAPEFEYEDWAIATRDGLHAAYLELVERLVRTRASAGDWQRGADVARAALSVDPYAEGIERNLIALYHQAGFHAAAAEQYAHFAATQKIEYGVEPPALEALVSSPTHP